MRTPLRTLLALTVLLGAIVAGCVAPAAETATTASATDVDLAALVAKLSPRLGDDIAIVHSVLDVETRHGIVNVDLYLPDVPEGTKLPLILVASPYNSAKSPLALAAGGGGKDESDENRIALKLYQFIERELMPRGYAFAQMDILGTRNSGGCMGIMNAAERQATADTIEYLATQPWSDGKVGMIGKSYLGLSQLGAAVENPEHLVTIVPISPPTHDYAYHYYNGVPYAANHATNFLYYGAYSLPPSDGDVADYVARYPERVPCAPEALAGGAYTLGDYSARWQERDYRPLIPAMSANISVFFVAGHQDWNVKPDHPLDVFNAIPGPKLGLFGQWGHDYPNINNVDETRWGERDDWYLTLHRWFDHHLKGIDTGIMEEAAACPVQTQDYAGVWRCADAFPPMDAAPLTLYPQSDGTLGDAAGEGSATFRDIDFALAEQAGTEQSEYAIEITDATRIYGAPEVTLRIATTSAYNAHVHAALAVVHNGTTEEVTWGFQSLRHRDGLEAGQPITPGAAYDITFKLYPIDLPLEVGDSLVLIVRGANGAGSNVLMLPNPQPGILTLTLGETSALRLPTATLDGVFTPLREEALPAIYVEED